MLCVKKLKFTQKELQKLNEDFDGYLWLAIDVHRSVISAGDEILSDLRDILVSRHSRTEDIVAAGIDLNTGELFIPYFVNRLNPAIRHDGLSDQMVQNVEEKIHYFFEDIPAYKAPAELAYN